MCYSIIFEKRALEFLNQLERNIKERVWNKLQQCKTEPFHFLQHLEEIDGFKLRVGDYRLIIEINQQEKILNVLKIGHRKNIYER